MGRKRGKSPKSNKNSILIPPSADRIAKEDIDNPNDYNCIGIIPPMNLTFYSMPSYPNSRAVYVDCV